MRFFKRALFVWWSAFLNPRLQKELGKIQGLVLKFWEKSADLSGNPTFFNFKWIKQLKKKFQVSWNVSLPAVVVKNINGKFESPNQRILVLWRINSDGRKLNILFNKCLHHCFWFFLILSLFETQNATKVTYIWPYFVCPEPVLGFFCQQKMPPLSEASPSKMGFASRTCCSIQECWPLIAARNCRISFVLSVFPAPDSPLQRQQESRSVKALLHPCQCPSLCLQRDCCLCASSFSAGRTRPLRMGFQHPKDWL